MMCYELKFVVLNYARLEYTHDREHMSHPECDVVDLSLPQNYPSLAA